ncbi:hypothetical protein Rhopal_006135-T1 [Rhodotorula paludigena]|uniref:Enzyme activator n=1 Tax=Rhodotorula paludigena TaxID=86838 RepID=A0AAV5GUB0_9BASI|nr:hypothetical protein Rhopal_006135-T1 [Rhodotorula paludigena]
MQSLEPRVHSPPRFHLDLHSAPSSSAHSAAATSGSTPRSSTPVPLLDSPSFDPALAPAPLALPGEREAAEDHEATSPAHSDVGALPSPGQLRSQARRAGAGRAKGPPLRNQTMDDAYYAGPGEPSALTRGKAPPAASNGQWGAIGTGYAAAAPPRAPGMYSQGNHSSPSLALGTSPPDAVPPLPGLASPSAGTSSFAPFDVPELPPMPAVDDLGIGLENMRFEQRRPSSLEQQRGQQQQPQRYPSQYPSQQPGYGAASASQLGRQYVDSAGYGPVGQDGAMEIRRGDDREAASVYSVESAQGMHGGSGAGGWPGHARTASASSSRYSLPGDGYPKRDSLGGQPVVEGYSEVDPATTRPSSGGSFLPYDDPYGGTSSNAGHGQQMHQSPYVGAGGDYFANTPGVASSSSSFHANSEAGYYAGGASAAGHYAAGAGPSGLHMAVNPALGYTATGASAYAQQQPPFQPQAMHGGWGYDYQAAAAARNPYYAAATGQLDPSSAMAAAQAQAGAPMSPYGTMHRGVSSASSLGLAPPGPTNSLSRSQSSLNVPGGGTMRRKATSGSTTTVNSMASASSGPPITKASVDEYRQRIKADPDPEAQFNFAKYLIEAAKKINSSATADEKSAKKYRDALLAESLKLIKRLATQGSGLGKPAYADAQFFLANCLGNGSLGLQIDHEKAYNLYVQASKQNHSAATYRTAVCNEVGAGTRRDHARAVLFYRKASALGDTAGMYKLGMILLHGHLGQQRNPKEGLAWLRRAASQADEENPHALHELGLLHEKPPPLLSTASAALSAKAAAIQQHQQAATAASAAPGGGPPTLVPYDPAQAREFFTQAAQLGYPPSQFKLGACYEYGTLTCPVDPRRSIAWYTRAAERGDPDAELALSGWYLTGSEGVLKQSDSEAYLWARRAANKGLPKAEYAVGYYSEVGIGVKAELEEAKRWYMRAAAQGNKRAMQRLTELKKLGADKRGQAGGKKRPTRKDAETECIIM